MVEKKQSNARGDRGPTTTPVSERLKKTSIAEIVRFKEIQREQIREQAQERRIKS